MDGRFYQNLKPHSHAFLPQYNQALGEDSMIRLYMVFIILLHVNRLKNVFWTKQNLDMLTKFPLLSYSLLSKILKFRSSMFRLVFLIKIVNSQSVLLNNCRLWH